MIEAVRRWLRRVATQTLVIIAFATPAFAIELSFPVECELGVDCYIQQYVDHDIGVGATDLYCGSLTYDGHKGTDIALLSRQDMENSVEVLAAAPGRVAAIRNSMSDNEDLSNLDLKSIKGKECGNGLVVDHLDDDGTSWTTQYCHMKSQSILARAGSIVRRGEVLGQVGLSGFTQFPHLHFMVRRDGVVYDPFSGTPMDHRCSESYSGSLWSNETAVEHVPGGIISVGLYDRIPTLQHIQTSIPHIDNFPNSAQALVFWAYLYGLSKGDVISTNLVDQNGTTLTEGEFQMDRNRAVQFRAVGKNNSDSGLTTGTYIGTVKLIRNGRTIATRQIQSVCCQ